MMFVVLFCVFFALFQVECTRADQISTKIYNGLEIKNGTYRFLVSIQADKKHICGGAIINEYYVLTAAHCFIERISSDIQIIAGTTNLNSSSHYRNVEEIISHNNFNLETAEYDIALVKMEEPFSLNDDSIAFINLPKSNNNLAVKQLVLVAGWGETINEEFVTELKQVILAVADLKKCEKVYGNKDIYPFLVTKRHFCVKSRSGIRGPCARDSGGPVIRIEKRNGNSFPIILGIISWADTDNCGNPKYPDVLTKVSKYLTWIKNHSVY